MNEYEPLKFELPEDFKDRITKQEMTLMMFLAINCIVLPPKDDLTKEIIKKVFNKINIIVKK